MTSSLQNITDAIAWSVYTSGPVGIHGAMGAGIGPRTTIASASSIGDLAIIITPVLYADGRSRIREGGVLTFRDNTGEEDLPISSVSDDGTTVTLDFSKTGYTGLQHAHATNAPVSSNVYGYSLDDAASMLDTGDPVFMAVPLRKSLPVSFMQGSLPTYHVEMQCVYKLSSLGMDPNLFAKRTQQKAWSDLEAIEKAILGNPKLNTDVAGPFASRLGREGSSADQIVWDLQKYEVQKDVWIFFFAGTLAVVGAPEFIG